MLKLKRYPKLSPYWYIRGTVKGIYVRESTGTADRTKAEELRLKREREIFDEAALGKERPATFAEAVAGYIGAGGEARFLMPILDHFKDRPVQDIRQADVDELVRKLYPTAKASTVNRQCISPIISVLNYARDAEMPGANIRKIRRRQEEKPLVTPASDEHIDKLLPHLSERLRALILMMTFTGLRTGEALRVQPDHVKDGFIYTGRTKNGDARMVPVPDGWEYPSGGWGYTTTQGVGAALRRAHKAAGLPYRDGHELGRHGFAFRWLKSGGSMKGLQIAGGWKKFQIPADIYGHLEITDVHERMRELSRKKVSEIRQVKNEGNN
jgi:integrase